MFASFGMRFFLRNCPNAYGHRERGESDQGQEHTACDRPSLPIRSNLYSIACKTCVQAVSCIKMYRCSIPGGKFILTDGFCVNFSWATFNYDLQRFNTEITAEIQDNANISSYRLLKKRVFSGISVAISPLNVNVSRR